MYVCMYVCVICVYEKKTTQIYVCMYVCVRVYVCVKQILDSMGNGAKALKSLRLEYKLNENTVKNVLDRVNECVYEAQIIDDALAQRMCTHTHTHTHTHKHTHTYTYICNTHTRPHTHIYVCI